MSKYYYEIAMRQNVDDLDDDIINDYIEIDDATELDDIEAKIFAANIDELKNYLRCEIIFIDKIVKETQFEDDFLQDYRDIL